MIVFSRMRSHSWTSYTHAEPIAAHILLTPSAEVQLLSAANMERRMVGGRWNGKR